MRKFFCPSHPVRCITTGAGEITNSCFPTNSILNTIEEYNRIYIYSPSLHQDLQQKLVNCLNDLIPRIIFSRNPTEGNIDEEIEASEQN